MMYQMASIHPDDRKTLVIPWGDHHYQMNRLPFGIKPAGYIAGRCLVELPHFYETEFPAAARAIRGNRYADDFCTGAGTLAEAKELEIQLTVLLSKGGFEIRRLSSNIPELFRETPVKLPSEEVGIKVLGVIWDQINDAFVARVVHFDAPLITKRAILSYIARIYDIMGFFRPNTLFSVYGYNNWIGINPFLPTSPRNGIIMLQGLCAWLISESHVWSISHRQGSDW